MAAGLTACVYLVPPVLEEFRRIYPNIDVLISTGLTENLMAGIRDGSIDIGVLTLPINSPDLEVIPFFREELVVVSSGRHPDLSRQRSIAAAELSRYPMILYVKGANIRALVERFFAAAGVVPRIAMESESFASIKPLVQINLGISILPFCAVQAEVQRGELHCLRVRNYELNREIGLVFQKTDHLPKLTAELVRLFRQYVRSAPDGRAAGLLQQTSAPKASRREH